MSQQFDMDIERKNRKTTTTSVLMSLSWVAGFVSFCFNSLSSFLSIVCIHSSQAIFQILLYALSTRFPFPSYFKLHNLTYLGADISTYYMTIPLQMALNYHIFDLYNKTHLIPKSISRHPIDQSDPTHPDHTTIHPTQQ